MKPANMLSAAATGLLFLALLLTAGCANREPPRYFTLEATKPNGSGESGPSIGLRPVEIPAYLRRSAIARETADHELMINTQERWAEPLEDGIRRVRALNLAATLPTNDVRRYPWTASRRPDVVITLQFMEFEAAPSTARLVVEVEIAVGDTLAHSQLVSLSTALPLDASGSEIAKAFSQLMRELAGVITPVIHQNTRDNDTPS